MFFGRRANDFVIGGRNRGVEPRTSSVHRAIFETRHFRLEQQEITLLIDNQPPVSTGFYISTKYTCVCVCVCPARIRPLCFRREKFHNSYVDGLACRNSLREEIKFRIRSVSGRRGREILDPFRVYFVFNGGRYYEISPGERGA